MKTLNHPNIIKYYGGWLDQSNKKIIMITEFFTGGNLKQHLKTCKKPRLRVIKKWIKEILNGLIYLHSHDIIHRDIKCDNFFIDKINGIVKIGDLGESQFLKGYNFLTNFVGTEGFIAPEVHEGKYNIKADIYSLGISIIEMLTLETPYKEYDGILQIYQKQKDNIYPESLFKIINVNVVDFIKLCLKNENERPSAKELIENKWLNDDLSEENDNPVFIKDMLRLNVFRMDSKKNNLNSFSPRYLENTKKIVEEFKFSPKIMRGQSYDKEQYNKLKIRRNSSKKTTIKSVSTYDSNSNLFQFKKKSSSFKISIKDIDNEKKKDNNEIEIQFIISKEKWKNKSIIFLFNYLEMLTCHYNLKNDTIEGLVNELTIAIDLKDDESKVVTNKLFDSIQNYKDNKREKIEKFFNDYSNLKNSIQELNNSNYTKNLSIYYEKFVNLEKNDNDSINKLNRFIKFKSAISNFCSCE